VTPGLAITRWRRSSSLFPSLKERSPVTLVWA